MKHMLILTQVMVVAVLATSLAPSLGRAETPAGDPVRGRRLFMQCAACHSTDQGGRAKVGPNLFGVIGSKAGARAGFAYSAPLAKSGVVWTAPALDAWLKKPSALVPGNQMAFGGMPTAKDRADVVAYLKTLKP